MRCKSYLKTIETNKADSKDATQDEVETFNEDTCEVCLFDVENVVHSTENNVGVQELFEEDGY